MTAWVKNGTREEVGIIVDYTDEAFVPYRHTLGAIFDAIPFTFCSLTKFNIQLVEAYLDIPFVETKCGYACSDQ
jgi:bacterial leucyl aminopeptidase